MERHKKGEVAYLVRKQLIQRFNKCTLWSKGVHCNNRVCRSDRQRQRLGWIDAHDTYQ